MTPRVTIASLESSRRVDALQIDFNVLAPWGEAYTVSTEVRKDSYGRLRAEIDRINDGLYLEELGDVDDLYGLSYDDTKVLKKLIEKSLQEDYWFLYGVLS